MPENQSRDPLLYIHQPEFDFPKVDMQQTYIVRNSKQKRENPVIAPYFDEDNATKNETDVTAQLENVENEHEEKQKGQSAEAQANTEVGSGKKTKKKELNQKQVQEVINQYHQQTEEGDTSSDSPRSKQYSYSFKRVKSFKEMNTLEKLNYLEHFPKLLPPVPCIFVTNNSSVRGYLLSKTEGSIEIKLFNDKLMTIAIDQISDIKMLGLQS